MQARSGEDTLLKQDAQLACAALQTMAEVLAAHPDLLYPSNQEDSQGDQCCYVCVSVTACSFCALSVSV